MTTLKQFEIQKQIKENSQGLVNKVNELHKWEKEMKRNSAENSQTKKNENSYPIRSHISNGYSKANETVTTQPKENNANVSLADANAYKDLGNKCFKNNNHEAAIENYTKAIGIKDDPVFYTNRALCFLKLERYTDCIADCSKALLLDPKLVKGYYRRMQANEVLCNFVSALNDCIEVLKLEPKNSDAVEARQRLSKRIAGKNLTPSPSGANQLAWSKLDASVKDVAFIKKPPHLRSKKPLRRIQINAPLPTNPPDKKSKDEENEAFKSAESAVDQSNQIDGATDKVVTMLQLKSPNSSAQFYQTWRELSDNRQKYSFLKIIDVTSLNKLLGPQFNSEMLKDLLEILSQNFVNDSIPVTGILKQIILNDEFKILKMFMDTADKNAFEKLLKYVESRDTNTNDLAFIKDKYFN